MTKKPSEKNKAWEKDRRDRLNKSFEELAKLLPKYDPSITWSKIEIIQKSISHIKDLHERHENYLRDNDPEILKQYNDLTEALDYYQLRNNQLSDLLKKSKITLPPFKLPKYLIDNPEQNYHTKSNKNVKKLSGDKSEKCTSSGKNAKVNTGNSKNVANENQLLTAENDSSIKENNLKKDTIPQTTTISEVKELNIETQPQKAIITTGILVPLVPLQQLQTIPTNSIPPVIPSKSVTTITKPQPSLTEIPFTTAPDSIATPISSNCSATIIQVPINVSVPSQRTNQQRGVILCPKKIRKVARDKDGKIKILPQPRLKVYFQRSDGKIPIPVLKKNRSISTKRKRRRKRKITNDETKPQDTIKKGKFEENEVEKSKSIELELQKEKIDVDEIKAQMNNEDSMIVENQDKNVESIELQKSNDEDSLIKDNNTQNTNGSTSPTTAFLISFPVVTTSCDTVPKTIEITNSTACIENKSNAINETQATDLKEEISINETDNSVANVSKQDLMEINESQTSIVPIPEVSAENQKSEVSNVVEENVFDKSLNNSFEKLENENCSKSEICSVSKATTTTILTENQIIASCNAPAEVTITSSSSMTCQSSPQVSYNTIPTSTPLVSISSINNYPSMSTTVSSNANTMLSDNPKLPLFELNDSKTDTYTSEVLKNTSYLNKNSSSIVETTWCSLNTIPSTVLTSNELKTSFPASNTNLNTHLEMTTNANITTNSNQSFFSHPNIDVSVSQSNFSLPNTTCAIKNPKQNLSAATATITEISSFPVSKITNTIVTTLAHSTTITTPVTVTTSISCSTKRTQKTTKTSSKVSKTNTTNSFSTNQSKNSTIYPLDTFSKNVTPKNTLQNYSTSFPSTELIQTGSFVKQNYSNSTNQVSFTNTQTVKNITDNITVSQSKFPLMPSCSELQETNSNDNNTFKIPSTTCIPSQLTTTNVSNCFSTNSSANVTSSISNTFQSLRDTGNHIQSNLGKHLHMYPPYLSPNNVNTTSGTEFHSHISNLQTQSNTNSSNHQPIYSLTNNPSKFIAAYGSGSFVQTPITSSIPMYPLPNTSPEFLFPRTLHTYPQITSANQLPIYSPTSTLPTTFSNSLSTIPSTRSLTYVSQPTNTKDTFSTSNYSTISSPVTIPNALSSRNSSNKTFSVGNNFSSTSSIVSKNTTSYTTTPSYLPQTSIAKDKNFSSANVSAVSHLNASNAVCSVGNSFAQPSPTFLPKQSAKNTSLQTSQTTKNTKVAVSATHYPKVCSSFPTTTTAPSNVSNVNIYGINKSEISKIPSNQNNNLPRTLSPYESKPLNTIHYSGPSYSSTSMTTFPSSGVNINCCVANNITSPSVLPPKQTSITTPITTTLINPQIPSTSVSTTSTNISKQSSSASSSFKNVQSNQSRSNFHKNYSSNPNVNSISNTSFPTSSVQDSIQSSQNCSISKQTQNYVPNISSSSSNVSFSSYVPSYSSPSFTNPLPISNASTSTIGSIPQIAPSYSNYLPNYTPSIAPIPPPLLSTTLSISNSSLPGLHQNLSISTSAPMDTFKCSVSSSNPVQNYNKNNFTETSFQKISASKTNDPLVSTVPFNPIYTQSTSLPSSSTTISPQINSNYSVSNSFCPPSDSIYSPAKNYYYPLPMQDTSNFSFCLTSTTTSLTPSSVTLSTQSNQELTPSFTTIKSDIPWIPPPVTTNNYKSSFTFSLTPATATLTSVSCSNNLPNRSITTPSNQKNSYKSTTAPVSKANYDPAVSSQAIKHTKVQPLFTTAASNLTTNFTFSLTQTKTSLTNADNFNGKVKENCTRTTSSISSQEQQRQQSSFDRDQKYNYQQNKQKSASTNFTFALTKTSSSNSVSVASNQHSTNSSSVDTALNPSNCYTQNTSNSKPGSSSISLPTNQTENTSTFKKPAEMSLTRDLSTQNSMQNYYNCDQKLEKSPTIQKAPVNWMTPPEYGNSLIDYGVSSYPTQISQTFDYNNRKNDLYYSTFPNDDNFSSWSPNKMLDTSHLSASANFGNYYNEISYNNSGSNFAVPSSIQNIDLNKTYSNSTNNKTAGSITEISSGKNLKDTNANISSTSCNQSNFFSVSQLVDQEPTSSNAQKSYESCGNSTSNSNNVNANNSNNNKKSTSSKSKDSKKYNLSNTSTTYPSVVGEGNNTNTATVVSNNYSTEALLTKKEKNIRNHSNVSNTDLYNINATNTLYTPPSLPLMANDNLDSSCNPSYLYNYPSNTGCHPEADYMGSFYSNETNYSSKPTIKSIKRIPPSAPSVPPLSQSHSVHAPPHPPPHPSSHHPSNFVPYDTNYYPVPLGVNSPLMPGPVPPHHHSSAVDPYGGSAATHYGIHPSSNNFQTSTWSSKSSSTANGFHYFNPQQQHSHQHQQQHQQQQQSQQSHHHGQHHQQQNLLSTEIDGNPSASINSSGNLNTSHSQQTNNHNNGTVPSSGNLTNFNLTTICPEINNEKVGSNPW